ncbi:MAG: hypothetical protein K6E33_08060 [Lachnospiraceae bacterium]|nr:hypothetical protein [Lachnospiraceae bacterium]
MSGKGIPTRTKILIGVMVFVLLGVYYYGVVYMDYKNAVVTYDTTELDEQIAAEQLKMSQKAEMLEIMANTTDVPKAEVATYDNVKQVMNELNDIFATSEEYSFSFEEPYATVNTDTVRRDISASFAVKDFQTIERILRSLDSCSYRSKICDLSMTAVEDKETGDKTLGSGEVDATLTVRFFETLYGASSKDGVVFVEPEEGEENDMLSTLSSSKARAESTGLEDE